ncbi:MAG: hypothetical protein EPN30_10565 [Actinomycetota bacterium]|nr:MAG: hypothetical protein EPN30_10565 [Actinomycetota bacterium]
MAGNDVVAQHGFSIGDHPGSRSLFGLRRSQVIGEILSLVAAFLALFALGASGGLLVLVAISVLASVGFLIGYRRQTLDVMVLALAGHAHEKYLQKQQDNRSDIFGLPGAPAAASYIVSSNRDGTVRISDKRRRRTVDKKTDRFIGSGPSRVHDVAVGEKGVLGVLKERHGKRGAAAFEIFGESFLYANRSEQMARASVFGSMLGAMSAFANAVDSLVFLYMVDPEETGDPMATAKGWPEDLKKLYCELEEQAIRRRCYLIVKLSDVSLAEKNSKELIESVSGLGLRCRPADSKMLAEIYGFGCRVAASRKVLHMRSSWSHILIGDRVMRLFDVAQLPTGEIQPDFLVPFISSLAEQSILSFELKAIDSRIAMKKVRSKRSGITADAGIRALFGFLSRASEARAISSLEIQENDLDLGYEMFSVTGHFAVFADDLAGLGSAAREAVTKAEKSGLALECAYGRQMRARRRLFGSSS